MGRRYEDQWCWKIQSILPLISMMRIKGITAPYPPPSFYLLPKLERRHTHTLNIPTSFFHVDPHPRNLAIGSDES
ncbi:unnamed protein product [Lactuca virosa]|uniref:Uncharacterized protein n=1 Tax=Lactuca virosa TaxID=75947 RepID=A0AAU9NQU9_9ASTR|nr:unnamed protein product [Lactuca virosa]